MTVWGGAGLARSLEKGRAVGLSSTSDWKPFLDMRREQNFSCKREKDDFERVGERDNGS